MRKIDFLAIHCSDSDILAHDSVEVLEDWHLQRGFKKIGYHFIITQDGVIHKGRNLSEVGAHIKGYNSNSVGICLTGRHKFSPAQFMALSHLCQTLCHEYDLEKSDIFGHRDFDTGKTCPNFDVHELVSAWEWH